MITYTDRYKTIDALIFRYHFIAMTQKQLNLNNNLLTAFERSAVGSEKNLNFFFGEDVSGGTPIVITQFVSSF